MDYDEVVDITNRPMMTTEMTAHLIAQAFRPEDLVETVILLNINRNAFFRQNHIIDRYLLEEITRDVGYTIIAGHSSMSDFVSTVSVSRLNRRCWRRSYERFRSSRQSISFKNRSVVLQLYFALCCYTQILQMHRSYRFWLSKNRNCFTAKGAILNSNRLMRSDARGMQKSRHQISSSTLVCIYISSTNVVMDYSFGTPDCSIQEKVRERLQHTWHSRRCNCLVSSSCIQRERSEEEHEPDVSIHHQLLSIRSE